MSDDRLDYAWSITSPDGVGVYVEAVRAAAPAAGTVEFVMEAGAAGWLRGHARGERKLVLPLTGHAVREPAVLYLVFETGGHVYAFETLEEAGGSLESMDLSEGHYIGAFSDRGEVISMTPGELWVEFSPSGAFDRPGLERLIRGSRSFGELAADPHRFALAVWKST